MVEVTLAMETEMAIAMAMGTATVTVTVTVTVTATGMEMETGMGKIMTMVTMKIPIQKGDGLLIDRVLPLTIFLVTTHMMELILEMGVITPDIPDIEMGTEMETEEMAVMGLMVERFIVTLILILMVETSLMRDLMLLELEGRDTASDFSEYLVLTVILVN